MHLHASEKDYQRPVMVASLLIAFLMLGGKLAAWRITGSAAILSDALESVVHLFATGFAAYSCGCRFDHLTKTIRMVTARLPISRLGLKGR